MRVNNRNNIMWIRAAAWIDRTGGEFERVAFVEIPFPQMVDALVSNQVDAAMVNEPFLTVGLQNHGDKIKVVSWPMSETRRNGVVSRISRDQGLHRAESAIGREICTGLCPRHGLGTEEQGHGGMGAGRLRLYQDRSRAAARHRLPVYDRVIEPQKIQDMIDLMHKYKILKANLNAVDLIHRQR